MLRVPIGRHFIAHLSGINHRLHMPPAVRHQCGTWVFPLSAGPHLRDRNPGIDSSSPRVVVTARYKRFRRISHGLSADDDCVEGALYRESHFLV